MNRRRFLKYAGMTAAVVGASALGLDYLSKQSPSSVTPTTSTTATRQLTTTSSAFNTSTQMTQLASLQGRLFFDYNGNGKQDGEEPAVAGALVQLKDNTGKIIAETLTDSSGDYKLEDVRTGYYRLRPGVDHFSDRRFTHMCTSPSEFRVVTDDYDLSIRESTRMDIGLMEGFLTLPFSSKTRAEIDRFYDHDPDPSRYLWWNGKKGADDQPQSMKRGWSPNHAGMDYYMAEGNLLTSPAPGRVRAVVEDDPGGKFVLIDHLNGFLSSCGHISKATVNRGDFVSRGQIIAISGKSGKATELANYPHDHFQVVFNESMLIDPYRPIFKMTQQYSGYYLWTTTPFPWISTPLDSNPNMVNHWTKENDPQYAPT
jgi:murein DD-endopeptidase MepM/ murein hydrolase activator NlpD